MNIAVMNWSVLVVLLSAQSLLAQEVLAPIAIWPATPPGRLAANGEEGDTTTEQSNKIAGMPLIRLGNVSKPTLTIYKPAEEKNSGAAVLICPGGAYRILAYDLEGTEVCQWLNSIGITAGLLKYRVPKADEDRAPSKPCRTRNERWLSYEAARLT
ncbi:MAG: hypothetical protein R3C56_18200 [Pirellulaceae bacterium]